MHSDLPLKFRRPIERPLGSPDTSAEFRSRTKCAFCVFFRAELPVDAVRSASSAGSRAYLRLGELGERHWLVFGQGCTSWRSYLVVLLDLRCFPMPDDCRASRTNRVYGIVWVWHVLVLSSVPTDVFRSSTCRWPSVIRAPLARSSRWRSFSSCRLNVGFHPRTVVCSEAVNCQKPAWALT